jgi:hypothetical protein
MSQRQHQIAADVVHRIDDEAQILQCGARRIADSRAAIAALAQGHDADELAAEPVMQVAHQPGALRASARGAGALSSRAKLAFSFVFGVAHLGDETAGKTVDLVQRAGEPPGQSRADRHQHRRIGQRG